MGDLCHALEIDEAWIGRGAADDDLRAALLGDALELVVVDGLGLGVHTVGDDVVQKAREVHRAAVGEMPAVIEAHAEHRVAGLDDGQVRAKVRAGAGVGLHVGVLRAVQLAGAVAGEVFHHVDLLAATVVALAGIALGVLVGEHAAHGLHDGAGGEVLRRDQLDAAPLAGELSAQAVGHLRVFSGEKFQSHLSSPLLIQLHYLLNAAGVAAAAEIGGEEGVEDALVLLERHKAPGKGDDVRIVVLAAQGGELGVDDVGGTHAGHLVGGHGHADARSAYEHAAVGSAVGHVVGHGECIVGIIHAIVAVGAAVDDVVPLPHQVIYQGLLLLEAGVVASDAHAHGPLPFRRECLRPYCRRSTAAVPPRSRFPHQIGRDGRSR